MHALSERNLNLPNANSTSAAPAKKTTGHELLVFDTDCFITKKRATAPSGNAVPQARSSSRPRPPAATTTTDVPGRNNRPSSASSRNGNNVAQSPLVTAGQQQQQQQRLSSIAARRKPALVGASASSSSLASLGVLPDNGDGREGSIVLSETASAAATATFHRGCSRSGSVANNNNNNNIAADLTDIINLHIRNSAAFQDAFLGAEITEREHEAYQRERVRQWLHGVNWWAFLSWPSDLYHRVLLPAVLWVQRNDPTPMFCCIALACLLAKFCVLVYQRNCCPLSSTPGWICP